MFLERLDRVRKTIGFRLALAYCALFVISTTLLFGLAYVLLGRTLAELDRDSLRVEVAELAHHYEVEGLEGLKRAVAAETDPFFVRLADARNATVWVVHPEQWAMFDLSGITEVTGAGSVIRVVANDQRDYVLEIVVKRLTDGSLLEVGKSTVSRQAILKGFVRIVGAVMIPIVLLGTLGGGLLAARALRPVRQLIQTVKAIESGAMHVRVPSRRTGDELDELGTLFNRMVDKIGALISAMRNALDNVAHDLRTPMTRLRGIGEIALRSDRGADAYREALLDCLEESDQILVMLDTLMDISEAETGTLKLNPEATNLSLVVEDAIDLYRHVAEEKAVAISRTVPKEIWVTADRSRMRQVVANLVDNAIKYTPGGGRITLRVSEEQDAAVITVEDTGIGMGADALPRIWDRLYRADPSRSQRGLGLGLSLVKAVVQAHGGEVDVLSAPGVGSVFTIRLPHRLALSVVP